jgi:hypothetical protein
MPGTEMIREIERMPATVLTTAGTPVIVVTPDPEGPIPKIVKTARVRTPLARTPGTPTTLTSGSKITRATERMPATVLTTAGMKAQYVAPDPTCPISK